MDNDSQNDTFLVELVDKILPNLPPRDTRNFFFDLADPAKRSSSDIAEVLQVISRFQAHSEVTLGLNYNEGLQVCDVLGLKAGEKDEGSLRSMATEIRRKLEVSTLVLHPVESAACATKDGSWWSPGPYCENPKSPPVQAITLMRVFVPPV